MATNAGLRVLAVVEYHRWCVAIEVVIVLRGQQW